MNVKSHSILFRVVSFIVCFSIFIGCCPTIFAENSGSIPVVKYKINGEILQATLINIGTFSDSEDTSIEMGNGTTGNVFLASLPEGAQVYQIIACITPNEDKTGLKIPYYYTKNASTSLPFSTIIETDDTISSDMLVNDDFLTVYDNAFYGAITFADDFTLPVQNVTGFVVYDFDENEESLDGNIIYIQIANPPQEVPDANITTLQETVKKVTDENADSFYHSDDRWNGRHWSKDGFWADMQPALTTAQNLIANPKVEQSVVDNANTALSEKIDQLIPITEAN